MKLKKLNRHDVIQSILKQAGTSDIKPVRVDKNGELVSRAMRAGDKLIIILEQARRVVGYNLFRNNPTQLERAKRYSSTFLKESRVLWRGEQQ